MADMGTSITIFGLRGAVGVTTVALNLGTTLGLGNKRTALIDFHRPSRRDVPILMNIDVKRSLDDLAALHKRPSLSLLKGYLAQISENFDFLPLSAYDRSGKPSGPTEIAGIIDLLKGLYEFVLLDAGPELDDLTVNALDLSDQSLIIIRNDFLSRGRITSFQSALEENNFPLSMIQTVLQEDPQSSTLPSVGEGLDNVLATLPWDDRSWTASASKALPISLLFQRGPYARAIDGLAKALRRPDISKIAEHAEIRTSRKNGSEKPLDIDFSVPDLKARVHQRLLNEIDAGRLELDFGDDKDKSERLRSDIKRSVEKLLAEEGDELRDRKQRGQLIEEIINETLGLGPLEELLARDDITEIMVNGPEKIYIEREGKISPAGRRFLNQTQLRTTIERIIAPLGRRLDESSPFVDARLPDGSRVNAIIPPLSLSGPILTIRKFSSRRLTMDQLIRSGTLSNEMAEFLRACVQARINIFISGGTGSGKTTLLNIVSGFIGETERIITIEDSAELNLPQEHVVTLESRPPNIEGSGEITIRDLVRNALRMRPDRIVVGECRGGEALDMLQAMNTGHDGSLTTGHANSARDMLLRLETMVMMSGIELPSKAIREQISSAINLLVHTSRMRDGSRKIVQIAEITGLSGDVISMQDIFVFKAKNHKGNKVEGKMTATGIRPSLLERFGPMGVELDNRVFQQ